MIASRRAVLELRSVSMTFPGSGRRGLRPAAPIRAVSGLSVTVAEAEIVALVGESGAGKSTVGRLVLGLERPTSGDILVDGMDITRLRGRRLRDLRRRLHLILQDPYQSLHPGMRVGEAVAEPLAIAGVPRRRHLDRVRDALEEAELRPPDQFVRRFPHELSGGQRQRVALARAVITSPRLIVADEPTSMLDVTMRADILALVRHMRDSRGIAVILITHDLAVARHVADRILVMLQGRLVEAGPSEAVVTRPAHPYTRMLLRAVEDPVAPASTDDGERGPCLLCGAAHTPQRCDTPDDGLDEVAPGHVAARHPAAAGPPTGMRDRMAGSGAMGPSGRPREV